MKHIATLMSSFVLGLAATLSFAGCGTGGNDDQTNLRFINAVAGVESIDLFIDGDMWFEDQGYLMSSGYFNFDTEEHLFQVVPSNSLTPIDNLVAALQDDQDYTYIAVGTSLDGDALMLKDNNERAGTGSFKLRMIVAIESSTPMNVYVLASSQSVNSVAPTAQNLRYRSVTQYFSGRSGTYNIIVTNAITGQVLGSLPDQAFNETDVYTLVLAQNGSTVKPVYPLLLNDSESNND
jgi:hypothetical protein